MNAHVKPLKFCKDCKFYSNSFPDDPHTARCGAPQRIIGVSLVTGEPKEAVTMCEVSRGFEMHCGESAKWFEARP